MKSFIIPIFIAVFLIGCEITNGSLDPDTSELMGTSSINSIPHYEDLEDILNVLEYSETESGRIDKGSYMVFEHYYNEALDELETADSEEDFFATVDKHEGIIYLDESDSTIKPVINKLSFRRFVDKDGLFVVGDFIHRFMENRFIVFGPKSKVEELAKATSINDIDLSIFEISSIYGENDEINGRIENNCGSSITRSYTKNQSGCKNDRKVTLNAETYRISVASGQFAPRVDYAIYAQKKEFCVWSKYKTTLDLKDMSFTVVYKFTDFFEGNFSSSFPDISVSNSRGFEYGQTFTSLAIGPLGSNPYAYFDAVQGKGGSRGTGSNYAIISCQ